MAPRFELSKRMISKDSGKILEKFRERFRCVLEDSGKTADGTLKFCNVWF